MLNNTIIPKVKIGIAKITVSIFKIITDFSSEINLFNIIFIACPPSNVETGNKLKIHINKFEMANIFIVLIKNKNNIKLKATPLRVMISSL